MRYTSQFQYFLLGVEPDTRQALKHFAACERLTEQAAARRILAQALGLIETPKKHKKDTTGRQPSGIEGL